jgi:hypothetical protein
MAVKRKARTKVATQTDQSDQPDLKKSKKDSSQVGRKEETTRTNKKPQQEEMNNAKNILKGVQYWLMKAEPESRIVKGKDVKFSIDDLKEMKTSCWDGVRNHAAKNHMRAMKKGDLCFFYHSNCKVPGIVGIMRVAKEAYPDCMFSLVVQRLHRC